MKKVEMMNKYETFEIFTTTILFQIGNKIKGTKGLFLRNSIAKTHTLIKSIEILFAMDLPNEAWILNRCLIDRFMHIRYLTKNDLYEDFKDWSYIEGYQYLQNAKSEEIFANTKKDPRFKFTKEQSKANFEAIQRNNRYNKPNPKKELKSDGLNFIYKLGYDYGSMRVHPMYEDGLEEYFSITKVTPNPYENFKHEELLPNSYLIASLILQEALNQIDLKTRAIVYEYIEEIRKDGDYQMSFYKIIKFVEQGNSVFE